MCIGIVNKIFLWEIERERGSLSGHLLLFVEPSARKVKGTICLYRSVNTGLRIYKMAIRIIEYLLPGLAGIIEFFNAFLMVKS
jgi:hypothetical protein